MNGTAKTKKWGDVPPSLIAIKKKRASSVHLLLDSGAEPQVSWKGKDYVVKSDAEAIKRLKSPFRGPGWKSGRFGSITPSTSYGDPQCDIVMETEYRCLQSDTKRILGQCNREKLKQTKKVS
jgi:hypothetical protein